MSYVDGYLLAVPKKNVKAYRQMAQKAGKIWMEFGALQYCESVGDDLKQKFGVPYTRVLKAKPSETVFYSFIVYKSRADRDRINAKVMKDPRIANMCDMNNMPFDPKRMSFGGFKPLVDLKKRKR